MPLLLAAVAAALASGALASRARADAKVDWSAYLEPAGSKGPAVKHDDLVPQPKPVAKAAKASPAPAAPKAKAKVPAKAKRKTAGR